MNTILFTSSTTGYNDKIADGLVHFTLSELIKGPTPAYAAYHPEEKEIEFTYPEEQTEIIEPKKTGNQYGRHSARYSCVRQLIYKMETGDCLLAHSLSDLGDTASEAEKVYFDFLSKGIELSFYDMSFLDTEKLKLNTEPTNEQKVMIRRIMDTYYAQKGIFPILTREELYRAAEMDRSKKKSAD